MHSDVVQNKLKHSTEFFFTSINLIQLTINKQTGIIEANYFKTIMSRKKRFVKNEVSRIFRSGNQEIARDS